LAFSSKFVFNLVIYLKYSCLTNDAKHRKLLHKSLSLKHYLLKIYSAFNLIVVLVCCKSSSDTEN